MADREVQRRLAAILAADVAGYTRLMEEDTDGTVAAWQDAREEVIKPNIADYSGRIVKLTGDGFLVEFPTVQDAVKCAIKMQDGLKEGSLHFRMGINLGDIVDDGEDIHGEGVNIAARIEGLAEPGGICISGSVHEQVRHRLECQFDDMGEVEVKNVSDPVRVFKVLSNDEALKVPRRQSSIKRVSLVTFLVLLIGVGFVWWWQVQTPDLEPVNIVKKVETISEKPSIAVLPFANVSGDKQQEYFSDGITNDIITDLSRFSNLFVIASNSVFIYKGKAVNIKDEVKSTRVSPLPICTSLPRRARSMMRGIRCGSPGPHIRCGRRATVCKSSSLARNTSRSASAFEAG